MALPNYLAKIKSSGIYRFVWDKSEIPGVEEQTLRLVVGYSEKGPFNTPVYITSASQFKTVFGNISKKLERYGCFFHRMALQALTAGPIIALNLKTFETEECEGVAINPTDSLDADKKLTALVRDIYDTNRFWKLEPEHLEEIKEYEESKKYVLLTHTDSDNVSNTIFIRGLAPSNYNITFKEWYSAVLNGAEMPAYIQAGGPDEDKDFSLRKLDQYFAEVYVFRGEFTKEICASENLAKYFLIDGDDIQLQPYILNAFGERIDTLEALSQNSTSNFINKYQGILLPEFQSATGSVLSLDQIFNSDFDNHKMMMRFNQSALYSGDITLDDLETTGWSPESLEGPTAMMSVTVEEPVIAETSDGEEYTQNKEGEPNYYKFNINLSPVEGQELTYHTNKDIVDMGFENGQYYVASDESEKNVSILIGIDESQRDSAAKNAAEFAYDPAYTYNGEGKAESTLDDEDREVVSIDYKVLLTSQTDPAAMNDLARMLGAFYRANNSKYSVVRYDGVEYTWDESLGLKGSCYKNAENRTLVDVIVHTTPLPESLELEFVASENEVLNVTITLDVMAQSYVSGFTWTDGTEDEVFSKSDWTLTFDSDVNIEGGAIYRCNASLTATSEGARPTYIKGYKKQNTKPLSSSQWDKKEWINNYILEALAGENYKGIREGLTNNVDSEWHYLVDTFEAFVEPEVHAKLAIICKEKDNALGLINFPKIKSFATCDYTSFTDSNNNFDMKYIAEGGNKRKPRGIVFSLASEDNGASFVSYNTPVVIEDSITAIKNTVPAAALVSNAYMRKYDNRYPYSIVAGPNYGVLTAQGLIGPDYNFSRADRDILEPFGVNCTVYEPRKGTFINSNQTAKQNPVTTLSKINVRELVIFLQDEIEKLLQDYQWEFNTQTLRDTVKSRADVILEKAKNNGGVYKYFNVCSEENNTPDVINNEMLVLSTSIEPGIGAGKMVQELTLYRHGGMSSIIK